MAHGRVPVALHPVWPLVTHASRVKVLVVSHVSLCVVAWELVLVLIMVLLIWIDIGVLDLLILSLRVELVLRHRLLAMVVLLVVGGLAHVRVIRLLPVHLLIQL